MEGSWHIWPPEIPHRNITRKFIGYCSVTQSSYLKQPHSLYACGHFPNIITTIYQTDYKTNYVKLHVTRLNEEATHSSVAG